MKLRQFAGLAMLLTVALVIVTGQFFLSGADTPPDPDNPGPANVSLEPITIKGIAGGKKAFFEDPDVARILKKRYGLTVDVTNNIGSIAMIGRCTAADPENWDFCIPQSQTASETIKANLGPTNLYGSEIIANTPLVIYSWAPVVDALIAQNLVSQDGDVYYFDDLPRLVQMILDGTTWADIGLPEFYGTISIVSSDPTKSSSGNTWAALLGSILNGGEILDETTVDEIGPQLKPFFNRLLSGTSTEMTSQFIAKGMGAYPLCVLYESHMLEESLRSSPEKQVELKEKVRTLYPRPTIWSTQYVIALSEGGKRLVTALRDPELQEIGWKKHAFRPVVGGVSIDVEAANLSGLLADVISVTSLPKPEVMTRLLEILSAEPGMEPEASPNPAASPTAAYRRDELAFRSTS
jgi:hypothetical protein